jgi:hypothetical protein
MPVMKIALRMIACVCLAAGICAGVAHAQTGVNESYCISDIDASAFPQVQATLRIVNAGEPVRLLSSMAVFENGIPASNVTLTPDEGSLRYVFVVDGGRAPPVQKEAMQRAIGLLADNRNAFREGLDEVMVLVLSNAAGNSPSGNTDARLVWKSAPEDLRILLKNNIFPSRPGPTRGLDGLDGALAAIDGHVTSTTKDASVIVFITHRIESATNAVKDAQDWASLAASKHVPIYAFQTSTAQQQKDPVIALATQGRFVPLAGSFDAAVNAAYDQMSSLRAQYKLSFTSASSSQETRRITVGDASVASACPDTDQYSQSVPLPSVSIGELRSTLSFNADAPSSSITARVTWPDGQARLLKRADLLVNNQRRARLTQDAPTADLAFIVTEEDFSGLDQAEVAVEVEDALGRSVVSSPPRLVAIERAETPAPTDEPEPLAETTSPFMIATLIAAGVALVASLVVMTLVVVRQKGNRAGSAKPAYGARVMLRVVEGPAMRKDERILLTRQKYVIGRHNADIAFYTDAGNSTVSRRHCVITREGSAYWLVDVSSNGTRVNDHKITPNERVQLKHGDSIALGDVRRNGVMLQFLIEDSTQIMPGAGRTGQTNF